MMSHKTLVIGCGSIGERHLRCFGKTQRCAVTACDIDPVLLQKMKDNHGIPVATDWKQAVFSGAHSMVVICTPTPMHLHMATCALEAGLHVLIEKPLSHSLAGVSKLTNVQRRGDRQVAVAYVFHMFPFLRQAREFLARGELGPVLQATVISGQPFHLLRAGYLKSYYSRHDTGGGAIQDALTHFANWMESVLGPTESLACDATHFAVPGVEVEDTAHILARQSRGARVSYALNQFQHPNESTIQLNTAQGSVRIEFQAERWGVFRAGDTDWIWHSAPVKDRDTHFIAQANAFLDQIEGQPVQLCSLEEATQTLRFNLAALASAASGKRVSCQEIAA